MHNPGVRPTTLLDDAWGASRPATDAELAEVRRMDTRNNIIFVTVMGVACGGLAAWIVYLVAG